MSKWSKLALAVIALVLCTGASLTDHSRVSCLPEGEHLPIYRLEAFYVEDGDEGVEYTQTSSAVVIAPGYALTAAHSVNGTPFSLVVYTPAGHKIATKVAHDPIMDMALLQIDTEELPELPLSPISVETGQRIWSVGYPSGVNLVSYEGSLVGEEGGFLLVAAPVFPGMSGGGFVTCTNDVPVLAGLIESFNYSMISVSERLNAEGQVVITKRMLNMGTSNGANHTILRYFVDHSLEEQQKREQEQE